MKELVSIAFVSLACTICSPVVVGQDALTDSCSWFVQLTSERDYIRAFAMLNQGLRCDDVQADSARVVVLAAHHRFDEALQLAHGLQSLQSGQANPHAFDALVSRMESITKLPESELMAGVQLYPTRPATGALIAMVDAGKPYLLYKDEAPATYFPAFQQKEARYVLPVVDQEDADNQKHLAYLQAWNAAELGPLTALPDGRMVVSALFRKSYHLKPACHGLYIFDPSRPEAKPRALSFCLPGHHYMHPTYCSKRSELIFSSDQPGGSGGMDLWKVPYENEDWGIPVNLGDEINSPGNELFPYAQGDSLFFSSDRVDLGYGGVDIYLFDDSAQRLQPMPAPINSAYDDFGMKINGEGKAFLSSNRFVKSGEDRVYQFKWESKKLFFKKIAGEVAGLLDPAGTSVYLLSSTGDTLEVSALNGAGQFGLNAVRGMRSYQVMLGDESTDQPTSLTLYDSEGNTIKKLRGSVNRGFIFELLTPEDYYLERMDDVDHSILDINILGQYIDEDRKPGQHVNIMLQSSAGETVARAYTDDEGFFRFEAIKPDANYKLSAEGAKLGDVIHILDGKGHVLQSIEPNSKGDFIYVRIQPDVKTIVLTNELKEEVRIEEGVLFDLPQVQFQFNSAEIRGRSLATLQRLLHIMNENPNIKLQLDGHTDARGPADYNLRLSEKRVESVIEYLYANGIKHSRLSGKGFGESQLLNHCSEEADCSDEQHAINRRTEFSIFQIDP